MNNKIYGVNGVTVTQVVNDSLGSNFLISVDDKLICKVDKKADYQDVYRLEDELNNKFNDLLAYCNELKNENFNLTTKFEKENKELRKIIANLNTRVNNLIAEKQVEKFYEKYSGN